MQAAMNLPHTELVKALGGWEFIPAQPSFADAYQALRDSKGSKGRESILKPLFNMPAQDVRSLAHKAIYERTPVAPITFFQHGLGSAGRSFFPLLQARAHAILQAPWITEVVLAGSIGWGKCVQTSSLVTLANGDMVPLSSFLGVDKATLPHVTARAEAEGAPDFDHHHCADSKASGNKPCMRVMLEDGRFVVATPDHRVRVWNTSTEQLEWVPIKALNASLHLVEVVTKGKVAADSSPSDLTLARLVLSIDTQDASQLVPSEVLRSPDRLTKKYIHSVFDLYARVGSLHNAGEGSTLILRHVSQTFLLQMQALLWRFEVQSYVLPSKRDPSAYELSIRAEHDKITFLNTIGSLPSQLLQCENLLKRHANARGDRKFSGIQRSPFTFKRLFQILKEAGYSDTLAGLSFRTLVLKSSVPRPFLLSWLKEHEHASPKIKYLASVFRPSVGFARITEIAAAGTSAVADLSVPSSSCFLANGITVHNSYTAAIGMLYDIYKLLCMRSPQRIFNNEPSTSLVFCSLAVTARNVQNVIWDYLLKFVNESELFNQAQFKPEIHASAGILLWPQKNIKFEAGSSSESSIIGQNVIGAILDEANFMISARMSKRAKMAGEFDQAKVIYDQLERRRTSRFLLADKSSLARFWLVSSKQFPGDFLEKRIKAAQNLSNVAVLDYPQWLPRMTSDRHPYGTRRFYLFLGNSTNPSKILGTDKEVGTKVKDIPVPPGCKIQVVPHILMDNYRTDLYGAIRDISGWSVAAKNPFFEDADIYKGCVNLTDLGDFPREHPFIADEPFNASPTHILPGRFPVVLINDQGEQFDPDNIYHRKRTHEFIRYPKLNPHQSRFVHIDLARTRDGAAIGMGHFGGYKNVVCVEIIDGRRFITVEERPTTIMDWMIRFFAPPNGRIEPKRMRDVVWASHSFGHYNIRLVTFDQYQSAEGIDAFIAANIESFEHSVDRRADSYQLLRQSMIDRRTSLYEYLPLFQDLSSLEYDNLTGKIDHTAPREDGLPGSKDVADCAAAIHFHVAQKYKTGRRELPLSLGELDGIDDTDRLLDILRERLANPAEPSKVEAQVVPFPVKPNKNSLIDDMMRQLSEEI